MSPSGQAFDALNRATLQAAALLVPRRQRAEWRKEWHAELWHVRQLCLEGRLDGSLNGHLKDIAPQSKNAERDIAAFCLGAFPDAFHLRREILWREDRASAPRPQHLATPASCLLLLAVLAVVAYTAGQFLPRALLAIHAAPYRNARDLILLSNPVAAKETTPSSSTRESQPQAKQILASQFRALKQRNRHLFEDFAFYQTVLKPVTLTPHHQRELTLARATPNLFKILGLPVHLLKSEANTTLPSLILSDAIWRRDFHANPDLAGIVVKVGLRNVQIAGVLPPHLWSLPGQIDAWLLEPDDEAVAISPGTPGFLIGHLKPNQPGLPLASHWTLSTHPYATDSRVTTYACDSLTDRTGGPFPLFVFTFLLAILALPATTSLPLGDYPAAHQSAAPQRLRRWAFLAAKFALLLPILYWSSVDLAYCSPALTASASQYLQILIGFGTSLFALRWTLRDQRRRCPVCLARLTHPARVGQPSRNFLAWNGTELICTGGHGMLHVPETPTSWFSTQRWLYLDPSWDVLFPRPV